ncbi:MAG: DUF4388 domain-containing protein [Thermoanaerobaculia bacterium]|nr:DUF4388 domain-containing protein [Thermoanaerobaculia bacterium]
MSDDLTIQGSLSETTVPDLFRTIIRSRENAVVSVAGDFRQDSFYFRDGHLAFASSTSTDLGLADVLLVAGEMNLGQYRTVTERAGVSRRVPDVILELGMMNREELSRAMELQITRIVNDAITLASGEYTIEFLEDFPSEVTTVSIESDKMILAAIGNVDRWSVVERGIGSVDRMVRQAAGADARAFALDLTEAESHVFGIVSEPVSVATVCERSYLPNFVVCRTVWALLVAGLLEDVRDSADEAGDERREILATEYELEGEVERYNTVFEDLFGVVFQRIGDYSFDFVDRVVSRVSPQNAALLQGMSMVNEGRVDVDQLLTNLSAASPHEKRQIVQDLMNELLYGWVLEIRTEFGDQLDAAVATAQQKIRKQ